MKNEINEYARGRLYVSGSGLGADGSVNIGMSVRFAQDAQKDRRIAQKVLAPDPASRAQGRLVEVQSREATARARQRLSVEASYQRHWDPPSRGMGPSLGR